VRVDCYNACSQPLYEVMVGDTFYYGGLLYLRVEHFDNVKPVTSNSCWAVDLGKGIVVALANDVEVTKADTKVVAVG